MSCLDRPLSAFRLALFVGFQRRGRLLGIIASHHSQHFRPESARRVGGRRKDDARADCAQVPHAILQLMDGWSSAMPSNKRGITHLARKLSRPPSAGLREEADFSGV